MAALINTEVLGVVIPVHKDGKHACNLAGELSRQADVNTVRTEIVVVDNGGNPELDQLDGLPHVSVVAESRRGPGHARSMGCQTLINRWRPTPLDRCWLLSLDADAALPVDFLAEWSERIATANTLLLVGGHEMMTLGGDVPPPRSAAIAAAWIWQITSRCEDLVGLVNVSGSNHAVRADAYGSIGGYNQPTLRLPDGTITLLAGDDWDFGLRARMAGFEAQRVASPVCHTSDRRLSTDPLAFLTGDCYEREFAPVETTGQHTWPPVQPWTAIAAKAQRRLVSHFLIKPLLCGIDLTPSASWLLGDELHDELTVLCRMPGEITDWNEFRNGLVASLFGPNLVEIASRVTHRLQGVRR